LENFKLKNSYNKSDIVGIIASSICIVHCVITPLIAVLFSKIVKEKYELLNYVFLIISLISVIISIKTTKNKLLKGLLLFFWIQLSVGLVLEDKNIIFSILMYFSALGLIVTHILNIKYCKNCKQ